MILFFGWTHNFTEHVSGYTVHQHPEDASHRGDKYPLTKVGRVTMSKGMQVYVTYKLKRGVWKLVNKVVIEYNKAVAVNV
jgi:methionyl-tRNA formyltransferase